MNIESKRRAAARELDITADRALARLADAQPFVVLYDQEVFPMRAGEAFLLARALGIGDVILPGPAIDEQPRRSPPPIPRPLTAAEIKSDPILGAIRQVLLPHRCLAVLLWPDGTLALTVTRPRAGLPAWWALMTYDVARCAPKLAEITQERDAEHDSARNANTGGSHARP